MGVMDDAERIQPESLAQWHDWLAEHHGRGSGVWLVSWRGHSGRSALDYEELVMEALCWGWIDSTVKKVDDDRTMMWFAPRKGRSMWVSSNKRRVAVLEEQGRIQPAGRAMIDAAKANGMWTLMDSVEALEEPDDLAAALDAVSAARTFWDGMPPSARKQALTQVALAMQDATRTKRVAHVAAACAAGERPY